MENNPLPVVPSPTTNGLKPNVAGALAYVLGFVSGLIIFLVSKDKFARFHGLQATALSIFMYIVYYIVGILPGLWALRGLIGLVSLGVSIFLIIKAYQGEKYKLPVLGDLAEKHA